MPKPKTAKILVSLWEALHDALERRLEECCLKRDAFLQRVITAELPYLDSELPKRNSDEAKRVIAKHLLLLPRKQITLNLDRDTVKRLDEICRRKNLVRDSFFNRLVLCLVAPPGILGVLFDAEDLPEYWRDIWEDPGLGHRWQLLRTMPEYINDPFGYIRACLSVASEENDDEDIVFYQAPVPSHLFGEKQKDGTPGPNTLGLNVYLADVMVPGHPANKKLLDDLIDFGQSSPEPAQKA